MLDKPASQWYVVPKEELLVVFLSTLGKVPALKNFSKTIDSNSIFVFLLSIESLSSSLYRIFSIVSRGL